MLINMHIGINGWDVSPRSETFADTEIIYWCSSSMQDVAQLRKDLNFTQHMLNADYENKLTKRATELWVHCHY